MKKCPMCAEEIKVEARLCRYCGARFHISMRGYCTVCHQIMDADENNACTRCGSTLTDLHIESEYIPPQTTPAIPTSSKIAPSSNQLSLQPSKKKSPWKWILVVLAIFIVVCLLVPSIISYLAISTDANIPATSRTSRPSFSQGPTSKPWTTSTIRPTITPTPLLIEAAFDHPSSEKGTACFITEGYGLTCLDETGWHVFTEDNSILESNNISDITSCPDGTLLLGNSEGAFLWEGMEWRSIYSEKYIGDVACSPRGEIWVTHGDGASTFDGTEWTHFDDQQIIADYSLEILSDCSFTCFHDIAISPSEEIWIVSEGGNLVHFDRNTWAVIESPYEHLMKIIFDQEGSIWAIEYSDNKLYHYRDEVWNEYQNPREGNFSDLLIDQDNRVWLSTSSGEVLVFNEGNWLAYDATAGGKIGPVLNSIDLDGGGRLWVGSDWGLGVFDGQDWVTYHMNTADLGDFVIGSLAVMAGGPDLPTPVEREKGTVTGKITIAGQPAQQIKMEVCQFHMGYMMFFTTSPCGGKHFQFEGTTDENGVFRLENLPPGNYSLFYLPQEEHWRGGKPFHLMPGEDLVLPDITTSEE